MASEAILAEVREIRKLIQRQTELQEEWKNSDKKHHQEESATLKQVQQRLKE